MKSFPKNLSQNCTRERESAQVEKLKEEEEDSEMKRGRGTASEELESRAYESETYWNERYRRKKGDAQADEVSEASDWCFSFAQMEPLMLSLKKKVGERLEALVVDLGCGISPLLEEMQANGWRCKLVGLDYSQSAVDLQNEKRANQNNLKYSRADLFALQTNDESVDLYIDKMTMDSMLHDTKNGEALVREKYLPALAGNLAVGGTLLLVSQMCVGQDHDFFQETIVKALTSKWLNWKIEVHEINHQDEQQEQTMPESPNVYFIKKLPVPIVRLRSGKNTPCVVLKVFSY